MRFLTFLSLAVLLLSFGNSNVYAQDTDVKSSADVVESVTETNSAQVSDSEIEKGEEENTKKTNVFSRASDIQIKEAQRFYKKCQENESLNARKDCKCAATTYLETRLKLGKDATIEQITAENINTCLKDEKTTIKKPGNIGLDVTKKQMEEAEYVYNWCTTNSDYSAEVDCECLAAKFLEVRIQVGPIKGQREIINTLSRYGECKNVVEATGLKYLECMRLPKFDTHGVEVKDFCECYSRKYGKLMKEYKGKIGHSTKGSFNSKANAHCGRKSSYK